MARLVVVTHEYDEFVWWRLRPWPKRETAYDLYGILKHFETFGHSWRLTKGPNPLPGDAAILHVDSTFVDESYLALKSHYPRTINFDTGDISKRTVSSQQLTPKDGWPGPVVVKSNLNHCGFLEERHNRKAMDDRRPLPHPDARRVDEYRLLDRIADVPDEAWSDPNLVVERFVPETDGQGNYVYRTWMFMGRRERCNRYVAPKWLVKAQDIIAHEPAEVPDEIRAERERLNFDYGKFDFVIHDGVPILMDANRTPGIAKRVEHIIKAGARNLAEGLHELVTGTNVA